MSVIQLLNRKRVLRIIQQLQKNCVFQITISIYSVGSVKTEHGIITYIGKRYKQKFRVRLILCIKHNSKVGKVEILSRP